MTLGPDLVGRRVVVRHLLPGDVGPSGGPAMTDVLGVLASWGPVSIVVRRDAGDVVTIPRRLIVGGKAVPPRRHRRSRPG